MKNKPHKTQMRPRPVLQKIQSSHSELIDSTEFEPVIFFNGLKEASLEQLVEQYTSMNTQFQMMKGLILLAARKQFPSNNEFSEWANSVHA